MAQKGFIYALQEPNRLESIRDAISQRGTFTDVISVADFAGPKLLLALLSFDHKSISTACIVRKGNRVATAKTGARFTNLLRFRPASYNEIASAVPEKAAKRVRGALQAGTRTLDATTWDAVWGAVKGLRPQEQGGFERLERLVSVPQRLLHSADARTVAQEKDAVGLALDIVGIDRRPILEGWVPEPNRTVPFLQGLTGISMPEDTTINHDAQVLDGWKRLGSALVSTVTFESNDRRLTVMNANRTPLERVLGVDLLYYHHAYDSFVFIQYKKMADTLGEEPIYRPAGTSYKNELERMRNLDAALNSNEPLAHPDDYRLDDGAFFFKLCPRITLDMASSELIRGMYLPLRYWEALIVSQAVRGPRGGIAVGFSNAKRWVNNSLFVKLVGEGWLGTRGEQTERFHHIIRDALSSRHSVVIAVSND